VARHSHGPSSACATLTARHGLPGAVEHSDWDVSKAAPGAAAQPGAPGAVQTDQVVVLCGKKTTMNAVVKLVLGGCVPSLVPHPLARACF
jgi:hypothetical protein